MKQKKRMEPDGLARLMKEEALDIPSEQLSERLLQLAMNSYQRRYSTTYKKEERLGKSILAILVSLNLWMLYLLKPFAIHPTLLVGVMAFVVGLAILITLHLKASSGMAKKTS